MARKNKGKTMHFLLGALVMAGMIAASSMTVAHAQGLSADFSDGSVIIGEDTTACDASMESAIRYNSVAKLHQYCDGVSWTGFVAFAPSVTLSVIPNTISNMNVTGPGTPAYGSTQTFTVKNFGATPSESLTVSFTDINDNFDVITDGCTGLVLNQNDSCDILIRPKAAGNGALQATLVIPHNNAPSSLLSGTASGFSCAPGGTGGGGIYVTCGAYNLVTTPGGCNNSIYPTCPGTADTLTMQFGSLGLLRSNVGDASNGPQNSVNLMAYVSQEGPGSHPAAEYCMSMVYGGFDDWYLPAPNELLLMNAQAGAIGGWQVSYVSSSQSGFNEVNRLSSGSIGVATNNKSTFYNIRCVRRETQALPGIQNDTTPDSFFFPPVMTTASTRITSEAITIASVTQDISLSLSNDTSGGARIKINGGPEVTSGTAGFGDQVQLVMTAPGSAGNSNTVDLTAGTFSVRWRVGVANATGTRRVFVSETAQGNFTGAAAADNMCQTEATAAGLGGSWKAMVSERSSVAEHVGNRLDFNWATLVNMNGQTVASGWNDLWDGSISNAINYDENGIVISTNTDIWSDTTFRGIPNISYPYNCTDWTTNSSSAPAYSYMGMATATGPSWIANTVKLCNTQGRFYCFENSAGAADTTPVAFYFNPMTKMAAASTTDVTSPSVTVTGINTATAVSISGAGNPEYRVNSGAWTSGAGTLNNGDTLTLRADAPASNGSRNKVTVTVGTYSTSWYVAAGDSGLTRRIFVSINTDDGNTSPGLLDALCSNEANGVGLGSNWMAIVSDSADDDFAVNRTTPNWGTLTNLGGEVVANNWEDLWDGALVTAVRYDSEYRLNTSYTWTGSTETGRAHITPNNNCSSWTTSTSSQSARIGSAGSAASGWISNQNSACSTQRSVYCIETAANAADTSPTAFYFDPMTTQGAASATDVASPTVTVSAISAGTAVSISGSGNPEFRVNSGAWTTGPSTINHGDTLTLRADAPASVNQRNKVIVTVGTYSTEWYVGAGNAANTKRVFVTSGSYTGLLGGAGGADSTCASVANSAGLGTGWKAILSDSGVDGYAVNRIPLNWGTLNNMNGDMVASSWNDLWDGSVLALINRTETNAVNNNFTWTASSNQGRLLGTQTCLDWATSSNSNTYQTRIGNSGTSGSWMNASQTTTCNTTRSLYCIEE